MFCGKCGKQIDENIKFCLYCGNPIRARIIPTPNIAQSAEEPGIKKPEKVDSKPIPEAAKSVQKPEPAPAAPKPVQEPASASMPITKPIPASAAKAYIPAPEKRVKPEKSKVKKKKSVLAFIFGGISLLLVAAILLMAFGIFSFKIGSGGVSVSTQAVSSQTVSVGFGTPEEAIEYFIEHIKSGDIDGALGACAARQMAENFDYEKQAQRINAVMPIVTRANVPSEYAIYAKYKENTFESTILMQLSHIIYQLNSQGEYSEVIEGETLFPIEDIDIDKIIKYFDPAVLSELNIVEIDEHVLNDDERNRENQDMMAKILGAGTKDFKSVLYELDGDYYVGGFTLLEYDGEWFIEGLNDPLMGMTPFGTLQPIDGESEFSDMLE